MRTQSEPRLAKWPFYFADLALFITAGLVCYQSQRPMIPAALLLMTACVALGAVIGILPFILEYRAAAKSARADSIAGTVAQIQNLEKLAAQISNATGQWLNIQEQADKTAAGAKAITEKMSAEAHTFAEFVQRANDKEKATLRLEVEKLRRVETDWLQVLVRMLDHVYALHQGAVRSRQPGVIEQVAHFQNACRDAARRVGLSSFVPSDSEPFDAQRHQVLEGNGDPVPNSTISETIAAGYTFQGKLVRPALVRLHANGKTSPDDAAPSEPTAASEAEQSQLPLEPAT
jgi:molecular chaperone GrpE (heat shock protein)